MSPHPRTHSLGPDFGNAVQRDLGGGGRRPGQRSGAVDAAAESYLMPIGRQNSGCARFRRSCSRLVTLARSSRWMSTSGARGRTTSAWSGESCALKSGEWTRGSRRYSRRCGRPAALTTSSARRFLAADRHGSGARPPPRRAVFLLFGRMRSRVAIAILAALGAGCASMRGVTLDRPKAAAVTPISPPAAAPPELHTITNPRIDVWERRLRTQPTLREATEDSLGRGATYLPRLCAILGEHGLPPDLALLPVVESGFWPTARGRAGERGLWQLRRDTARRFGLVVTGDPRSGPLPRVPPRPLWGLAARARGVQRRGAACGPCAQARTARGLLAVG